MNHDAAIILLLFLVACTGIMAIGILLTNMREERNHRRELVRIAGGVYVR